jgi:hypothetical protein
LLLNDKNSILRVAADLLRMKRRLGGEVSVAPFSSWTPFVTNGEAKRI